MQSQDPWEDKRGIITYWTREGQWTELGTVLISLTSFIDQRIFPIGVKFLKFASLEDSFVKLLVSVLDYCRLTKTSQFWIRNK